MTPDEHQRERMATWRVARCRVGGFADGADELLAEFDKRFPAPASPSEPKVQAAVEPEPRIKIEWPACGDAELAALREKARLWDAVASGKVQLRNCTEGYWAWFGDGKDASKVTDTYSTAAEAVQAAIDAGALK